MSVYNADLRIAPLNLESFVFHAVLGEGGFGKVVAATHRYSKTLVAIKMVSKSLISDDPESAIIERQILEMAGDSHFCTRAYATFQTEGHLFFIMDYVSGGNLFNVIYNYPSIDINSIRILAAEMLCGLQYLHSKGVVHRDLKPDNILLDAQGHIRIADYGLALMNMFGSRTETEAAGTYVYRAPEMIKSKPYDRTADYFSLGLILFETAFKRHPFYDYDGDEEKAMASIRDDEPVYPEDADPDLLDLIRKLLCKNRRMRKWVIINIRDHPFFQGVDWEEVENKTSDDPKIFGLRKSIRIMARHKIEIESFMDQEEAISPEEQRLFDGFEFLCDEWRAFH